MLTKGNVLFNFTMDATPKVDKGGCAYVLLSRDYKDPQCVVCLENHPADSRVKINEDGRVQTLSSRMGTGGGNVPLLLEQGEEMEETNMVVRRLTPLECERLQGFPDGWTDIGEWTDSKGKVHKSADSPRYKALGNSLACPFWFYLLRRISAQYERPATMGSLFSGIGGFDLCWARCNGSNSVLWSSEIEEFPIAVMKKHFGDEATTGDIQKYL